MPSVVAQIKVRQGNLVDLPVLEPGEFGYATDVQRLYIGNNPTPSQTGDGSETVFSFPLIDTDSDGTTTNNAVLEFGNKMTYAVYVDDTLQSPSTYTANDSAITFNTAPANGAVILCKFNTEVITSSPDSDTRYSPDSRSLTSSVSATNAGIAVDGSNYDYVDIQYILKNTNGRRKGVISVSIDATGNTSILEDSYVTSVNPTGTDLDNVFSGVVAGGIFNLQYTATNNSELSYLLTNWKSV
jgi:hypothetical protein